MTAPPEDQPPLSSHRAGINLPRVAAAVAVLAIGIVVLWQAGILFGSDDAEVESGGATVQLAPADASIDTPAPPGRSVGIEQGNVAPDFEFSAFDGERMRLSDFRGRPVFVNFWATWCQPCRNELPAMDELLRDYDDQGLAIIAVNNGESFNAADRYLDKLGVQFTAVAYDPDQDIVGRYGIIGMPTSYFIDRNGVITQVVRGELRRSDMEHAIQQVIAAN